MTEPSEAPQSEAPQPTRMLFLGSDSLADGFRLIGFETYPSPSTDDVNRIFRDLQRTREKAFVIVDDAIMRAGATNLQRVRDEGGRIVVVSVPDLAAPARLSSEVADRLAAMFGSGNLIGS